MSSTTAKPRAFSRGNTSETTNQRRYCDRVYSEISLRRFEKRLQQKCYVAKSNRDVTCYAEIAIVSTERYFHVAVSVTLRDWTNMIFKAAWIISHH